MKERAKMKSNHIILTLCILLVTGIFAMPQTVSAQCCVGVTGDVDGNGSDDISDLLFLVDYQFVPGAAAPPCIEEADVDGSGSVDISDLLYLVDYQFVPGAPAPVACPVVADDNIVFDDQYASGTTYEAFDGSLLDAVQVSADSTYAGTNGLEVRIPGVAPWWSGGAFTDSTARDLSMYNALTFWAKASINATLDVAGLGNDNTGSSLYTAEMTGLALTTSWQQYVIPIPLASKLVSERGLFYFAEGEGAEYNIWVDEIVFDSLTTITNPRPDIGTSTLDIQVGNTSTLGNGSVIFDVGGSDVTVSAMPSYFTYNSSDPLIASVDANGVVTAVSEGTVTITADLGSTSATGTITVNVLPLEAVPTTPAPTPTVSSDSVISLYSAVYTDIPVDTWSADWDNANVEDFVIGTDSTKKYTLVDPWYFAGIEYWGSGTVDATGMSHFHMDVWTPDEVTGKNFKIKLVDAGPDGDITITGDNTEYELSIGESSMSTGSWVSIDVPLSSFPGMNFANLAQLILAGDYGTFYVDNIYFYDAGLPTEPTISAPTPTQDQAYVLSLFSDTYTDATTVGTWSAVWDNADVADFTIGSDNLKKYTNLSVAGIDFDTFDVSGMMYFHMDVWTPDVTDDPANIKVKLVDFGGDGAYGGGDDVEHELTFGSSTMNTGDWVSIEVPMTDFVNLTTTGHLAQMIISGSAEINTLFVDNIYFYMDPQPTTAAPTPTLGAADVISYFSDVYTDITIDTWSAAWDNADVEDFAIGSDNTKKYTLVDPWYFAGVEYWAGGTLDATTMTHFHIDIWTSEDVTGLNFKVKLVDAGADGDITLTGDNTEYELSIGDTTLTTGSWVSIEVPLTSFPGMNFGNLAQLIFAGDINNFYVDNIYLHK